MPWPTEELKLRFNRPENADLLLYLEEYSPHVHSDLGMLLFDAAKKLPGVQIFGPDIPACSYVFAHTSSGVAFVLAVGMRSLVLRLPEPYPETRSFEKAGSGWHEFDPFDPQRDKGRNAALVRELASAAFAHAESAA